jgi:molecular chaperone Hsp33
MTNEELKKQYLLRDRIYRVISKDGKFRASVLKNTGVARTAQIKHDLSGIPAFYLARTLSAASLVAAFLKGEERIIINISGEGIISKIFAESIHIGEVRGFIINSDNIEVLNYNSFSDILLPGTIMLSRVFYNKSEPVTGIVELQHGDVSTDLAYYFAKSEQIPSAVILGANLDENSRIKSSGGVIIQAMPGATSKEIRQIHDVLSEQKSFTDYLESQQNLEEIMREYLPFEFDILATNQIDFFCRCSKEKFIGKLISLGIEEIKEMRKESHFELVCQYCSSHYYLDNNDFDRIIEEIQAINN